MRWNDATGKYELEECEKEALIEAGWTQCPCGRVFWIPRDSALCNVCQHHRKVLRNG